MTLSRFCDGIFHFFYVVIAKSSATVFHYAFVTRSCYVNFVEGRFASFDCFSMSFEDFIIWLILNFDTTCFINYLESDQEALWNPAEQWAIKTLLMKFRIANWRNASMNISSRTKWMRWKILSVLDANLRRKNLSLDVGVPSNQKSLAYVGIICCLLITRFCSDDLFFKIYFLIRDDLIPWFFASLLRKLCFRGTKISRY